MGDTWLVRTNGARMTWPARHIGRPGYGGGPEQPICDTKHGEFRELDEGELCHYRPCQSCLRKFSGWSGMVRMGFPIAFSGGDLGMDERYAMQAVSLALMSAAENLPDGNRVGNELEVAGRAIARGVEVMQKVTP